MRDFIERAWQQGHMVMWLLWPLMMLYWLITSLRRLCYKVGIFSTIKLPVPVIIVGNITVGGNGKTPMVVWLADNLAQQGYHVGIISRGYGGNAEHAILVDETTPVAQSGDEPKLIVNQTGCMMAIGRDRIAAANLLLSHAKINDKPIDVIISDDGLQHYRLQRDIEIAIVDGARRFGNGWLLPMGPLRERTNRLQQVDVIICNGGTPQGNEHGLTLVAGDFIRLTDGEHFPASHFTNQAVVAMAGIGYPQRFFDTLNDLGIVPSAHHPFVDHQQFAASELSGLTTSQQSLLMTEKDAVKCGNFGQDNWYYLPVKAEIGDTAQQIIFNKLKELS